MKGAKKILNPVFTTDYEIEVGNLMEKELVDLGLISLNDIKSNKVNLLIKNTLCMALLIIWD